MSVEKRFRRCVDPCQRCLTLDDTHDLCVMCLGEEHARSVLEGMECVHCEPFFCGKKAPLSVVPFSRENWGDHLPPAAWVPPLLRQWRDWVRGDRRWSLRTSLRERNFSSRARQRLTRVYCGRKMYCLLHLLIQQKVLYWLMVCFPWCRAAGGYEACASAR